MTNGTRRRWGISVTLWPLFTPWKDQVPIVQKVRWAPGPVWTDVENLAPQGFDPRTVQPVASRYTDYATRPTPEKVPGPNLVQKFLAFYETRRFITAFTNICHLSLSWVRAGAINISCPKISSSFSTSCVEPKDHSKFEDLWNVW